jgi:hypothetical protein
MKTSAFGFLRQLVQPTTVERIGDDNRRGGWTFNCRLDLPASTLVTRVIGVPHPSYFAPGNLLAEELRALARAAPPPVLDRSPSVGRVMAAETL